MSDGRHVFISGASRGIGAAVARRFVAGGDRVTLAARSLEACTALAGELGAGRAMAVPLDVADASACDAAIALAVERFGPVDVLVGNAGSNTVTPAADTSEANRQRWRDVLETNLLGAFWLTQAALDGNGRPMPAGGRILFVSSVLGRFGAAGNSAYSAAKTGLLGLVRSLALELAARHITVNALCPGWVETDMARAGMEAIAEASGRSFDEVRQRSLRALPIRRMIDPAEVAEYAHFIAGTGGAAVTGQGIDISCGSVMV